MKKTTRSGNEGTGTAVLGIDVSKETLDLCLIVTGREEALTATVANTQKGFERLLGWLAAACPGLPPAAVHACLESTGRYSEPAATALHGAGLTVSVLDPTRIHYYRRLQLQRHKTDRLDARLIAEYCLKEHPRPWEPSAPAILLLRALVRRRAQIGDDLRRERLRLESALPQLHGEIRRSVRRLEKALGEAEQRIRRHIAASGEGEGSLAGNLELLLTIPGVGEITAWQMLAEIDPSHFRTARQVAKFAGLNPAISRSGTSLDSSCLSRRGNARLRTALYLPAITAMRFNPVLRSFAGELEKRGKKKKQIIVAVMRKLLHIMFGVLKTNTTFNPELVSCS